MRKITSTLAEMNATLNKFGITYPELVNLHGPAETLPVKQDAHVNCQMVGEWLNGCNAHVESYNDFITSNGYDGIELPSQYLDLW